MAASATTIILASLLVIPIAVVSSKLQMVNNPMVVFLIGVFSLVAVTVICYIILRNRPKIKDSSVYLWSIFLVSSVADIIIFLENNNLIAEYIGFYLKEGEPYLRTAHGTMICGWDGSAHVVMYYLIFRAIDQNASFRRVGLYWFGSIFNSLIILVPGSLIGYIGVKWSIFLNVPFVLVPLWFGWNFLRSRDADNKQIKVKNIDVPTILHRPVDIMLILYCIFASFLAVFRGLIGLGCNTGVTQSYLRNVEPYITDPTTYGKMQVLIYFCYFLPYYIFEISALIHPRNQAWAIDWALIHAGAAAQAQFSYMGSSVDGRTDEAHRVPNEFTSQLIFWTVNGLLFIIPQLLAYRTLSKQEYYLQKELTESKSNKIQTKVQRKQKSN